ncbi:MAG: hypothetical protein ACJAYB_001656 [Psychromonas sp.]|jgi:hypothetical protein
MTISLAGHVNSCTHILDVNTDTTTHLMYVKLCKLAFVQRVYLCKYTDVIRDTFGK